MGAPQYPDSRDDRQAALWIPRAGNRRAAHRVAKVTFAAAYASRSFPSPPVCHHASLLDRLYDTATTVSAAGLNWESMRRCSSSPWKPEQAAIVKSSNRSKTFRCRPRSGLELSTNKQFRPQDELHPGQEADSHQINMELPPVLRQTVKTQNPLNGELSHGIVA